MQMLREFKIRSTKSRIPATPSFEETGIKKVLSCAKLNWSGSVFLPEKRYAILSNGVLAI